MRLRNLNFEKLFSNLGHSGLFAFYFTISLTQISRADWGANFGGYDGSYVQIQATAVDATGNVYLAGHFTSTTFDAGGFTLTRIGSRDAFVIKMDAGGTTTWAKNFGGSGAVTYGQAIAVDGSNNVYIGGYFQAANLTTPTLTKIGTSDAFVTKVDSSGTTIWSKNFGGSGAWTFGQGIAVDGSNNVYLSGRFTTANLTNPVLTKIGAADVFALKLDSSGNTTWAKNFGGSGASGYGLSVAVDGSGNVYLGGFFDSGDFTTPALTKIGNTDAFAFKLDASGTTTWSKNFGGSGANTNVHSIAVDGSGNVYLGGNFQSANLTTPNLAKIGTQDILALKLDSSGSTTWAKNFGGIGASIYGQSIAIDATSNVYLGGYFQSANLTTPALTKIGTSDFLALKLDSSGVPTWSKNFGGTGSTAAAYNVAVDVSGNVYLAGVFTNANLTNPALTKLGIQDAYSIKLNSAGDITWVRSFGGLVPTSGTVSVNGVAKDPASGAIYLTGTTSATYTKFGNITLEKIGASSSFLVKLDAFGVVVWANLFGGSGANTSIYCVTVDGSGNIYMAGSFSNADLTTPALAKIGTGDVLVIKLDSSGNTTWSKNFGGVGATAYGRSVAVDGSGNIYLGGNFQSASLTTPALTGVGNVDAFAFKLDSSGTTIWAKSFGGSGASTFGYGIAVDAIDNVYLSGNFSAANLTTPVLTKIGTQDGFTIKLDSSGTTVWAKNFGGSGASTNSAGIAVDVIGNVYFSGNFSTANLTTPVLIKIGTQDGFAIKLDSSGTTIWAKNFGGSGASMQGQGIAVDSIGNVFLGGKFFTANLTTPTLVKIGSKDAFALKLDSSGTVIWAKNYGGSGATANISALSIDGTGNVYLAGYIQTASLTTPALTKIGNIDALIIDAQVFNSSCTISGKVKFDSGNNLMVFCDGANWQSMNSSSASTCTGTTTGKLQYYSNGASSDFVWYAGSCRSAKSATTFGACAVNGKWEWDSANSTARGCINGTWTSLKGW
jgi:hypothetical protein